MDVSRYHIALSCAERLYDDRSSGRLERDFFLSLSSSQQGAFFAAFPSLGFHPFVVRGLYDRASEILSSGSLPSDLESRLEGEDSVPVLCMKVMYYIFETEMRQAA